jgi:ribonuclease VapC
VIDSSALIALLLDEPETPLFVGAIAGASIRLMSAASYLEAAIVMLRRAGPEAQSRLDRLLADLDVEVVAFTREQADAAIAAFRRYGRGSGHPANLNFGDCFSYALAKLSSEPLLFKGGDFNHTDLVARGRRRQHLIADPAADYSLAWMKSRTRG